MPKFYVHVGARDNGVRTILVSRNKPLPAERERKLPDHLAAAVLIECDDEIEAVQRAMTQEFRLMRIASMQREVDRGP